MLCSGMCCDFWIMCHVQDYVLRSVLDYVLWFLDYVSCSGLCVALCSGLCVLDYVFWIVCCVIQVASTGTIRKSEIESPSQLLIGKSEVKSPSQLLSERKRSSRQHEYYRKARVAVLSRLALSLDTCRLAPVAWHTSA